MKLRNKKTGIIGELHYAPEKEYCFTVVTEDPSDVEIFKALEALAVRWEDYKPAEPLIEDPKVRKAVRAWAEANDIEAGLYDADTFSIGSDDNFISFNNGFADETKIYTIAELCGEEEE